MLSLSQNNNSPGPTRGASPTSFGDTDSDLPYFFAKREGGLSKSTGLVEEEARGTLRILI